MSSVYVETTIPSYLTAAPSRDLVVAGHQQVTHTWWRTARERFDLFISEAVLREVRAGIMSMLLGVLKCLPRFPFCP